MARERADDSSHDASALVGVAAILPRDGRLLVIRRSAHVIAPGAWCFPGGAIESGETPQQAVVREMQEEVGLAVRPLRVAGYCQIEARPGRLQWWLVEPATPGCYDLHPNPSEVAEARWLTPEEIRDLPGLLGSNKAILSEPLGLW
jgi:8-oxo-dGTP diphosphatase